MCHRLSAAPLIILAVTTALGTLAAAYPAADANALGYGLLQALPGIYGEGTVVDAHAPATLLPAAYGDRHQGSQNLMVSAASTGGHFAGSMVVEVAVYEPSLLDLDGNGEPHVSINGATLRMAQARDGYWYGYFANADAAQRADQISHDARAPGQGLDFGVFCGPQTPASVLGVSFDDTKGVAVPRSGGLMGHTDGLAAMTACSGNVDGSSPVINNVLRSPPSIARSAGAVSDAQAGGASGIDHAAWPVIQLYSFSGNVRVQYERGAGPQDVTLHYGDMPSISHQTDRADEPYPARAEVILRVNDPQLNQDPTDEDSWTFAVEPGSPSVFYQAFYDGGRTAANGGPGLADLYPHLGRLGFDDNGYLEVDTGGVMLLRPNGNQPTASVHDGHGLEYGNLVTLVESGRNTGIFESVDAGAVSVMHIAPDAPRGMSAVITYNDRSHSVLTGSYTASLSLPDDDNSDVTHGDGQRPHIAIDTSGWRSGLRIPIILYDQDQNTNPSARDNLDVFNNYVIIPTIRIGAPLTAHSATDVTFYPNSGSFDDGVSVPTRAPDRISARLHIDAGRLDPSVRYEMISISLGYDASLLRATLIDASISSNTGTNWINLDLRSLEMASDSGALQDAALYLYAGGLSGGDPILISRQIGLSQGLVRVSPEAVAGLAAAGGPVHAVLDFGSGGSSGIRMHENIHAGGPQAILPVVFDVFSFGMEGKKSINNAIYRLELEETSANSGEFAGTLEFAAANQLNIDDPEFARSISPIDHNIRFIITDRMIDEDGITITYYDLASVGSVVPQSASGQNTEAQSQSGTVSISTPSGQLRFGVPVTITLADPDLNTSADTIEIYRTVNAHGLPSTDTVGSGHNILLEITFKGVRYQRCVVDGMHHGGLASTGFALVETGRATGVFEGVFKMPTWVCDKSGSKLMSTAGGSMDVIYYDARDSTGNPAKFSLLRSQHAAASLGGASTGVISDDYGMQGHDDYGMQGHDDYGMQGNDDYGMQGNDDYGMQGNDDYGMQGNDDTGMAGRDVADMADATTTAAGPLREDVAPQEPFVQLSHNYTVLEHAGDSETIILTGSAGGQLAGSIVHVHVIHPDYSVRSLDLRVGAGGMYGTLIGLEGGKNLQGTYLVNVTHGGGAHTDTLSFYVESIPLVLPDVFESAVERWIKNVASRNDSAVATDDLSAALLLLADMNIISISDDLANAEPVIPDWLSHLLEWQSRGMISDDALVYSLQYVIDAGVLVVGSGDGGTGIHP